MTVRPTEFSSAIADHRSCQMHRQVFWVTLGDPLLGRKRRHACTGRQPRVVVLPTGASLQLLRYQPFRRKHGCHLVASHSPALRWNLKVASTTTPTHGASGTARHDRLRQIGDAGAAHAERDWSPKLSKMSCRFRADSPVAADGTPSTGESTMANSLGGPGLRARQILAGRK